MKMIQDSDIYNSLIQLIIHDELITWTRLSAFLTYNSILILTLVIVFTNSHYTSLLLIFLCIFCIIGVIVCIFFAILGWRGRQFLEEHITLAVNIENDPKLWPKDFKQHQPINKVKEKFKYLNNQYIKRKACSKNILIGLPIVFIIFYIIFFLILLFSSLCV